MLSVLDFFFNDTATTEIYTLSLHDALPICPRRRGDLLPRRGPALLDRRDRELPPGDLPDRPDHPSGRARQGRSRRAADRKSTRLNSSHANISYAVFCLKKKRQQI